MTPLRTEANVLLDLGMDFCSGSGPTSKGCWPTAQGTSSEGPTSNNNNVLLIIGGVILLGATTGAISLYFFARGLRADAEDYSEKNMPFLLADLSRGEGEHLETYATLMGCRSRDGIEQFAKAMRFQIFGSGSGRMTGHELTAMSTSAIQNDPHLWIACSGSPVLIPTTQTAAQ